MSAQGEAVMRGEWPHQPARYVQAVDFDTIDDLERFVTYHRAYIVTLALRGSLVGRADDEGVNE